MSAIVFTRRAALPISAMGLLAPRAAFCDPAEDAAAARVRAALAGLDAIVERAMAATSVPGVAVAVVWRDEAVFQKGFGVRQVGRTDEVGADTLFALASVSKPVAATVVAALAGDGLAQWDDPVIRHFPEFALHDPWVTSQVTLRDLFAHRSGLPDHAGDAVEDLGYGRAEVLRRLRLITPGGPFRASYAYTNFGLTAAAEAAARAAKASWEAISVERLYRPLGMSRTSSRFADYIDAPDRAFPHIKRDGAWKVGPPRQPDAQSPAGGVFSTARDMSAWMRLQLGRGMLGRREIAGRAALDETHRPQIARPPAADDPGAAGPGFYGLGWNVDLAGAAGVRLSHSGAFAMGAATCVTLIPTARLGIVTLTNAAPVGLPEAINQSFLDLALTGAESRDWLSLFGGLMRQAMAPDYGRPDDYARPPAAATPPLNASAYTGSYDSDLYGRLEVAVVNDALALELPTRYAPMALRPFDRDVFTFQPTGENAFGRAAARFVIGAGGTARSVTLENLDLGGQGTFNR